MVSFFQEFAASAPATCQTQQELKFKKQEDIFFLYVDNGSKRLRLLSTSFFSDFLTVNLHQSQVVCKPMMGNVIL